MPFGSRKAWAWPPNKQNAWVWPPQGASGGALDPSKPPLPTSVTSIEYWHSEKQCAPAAWIGQLAATSLPGIGGPSVAADPGFFKGRVVAQASIGKNWANRTLSTPLVAAGTTPWTYFIGRYRGVGAFQIIYGMGNPSDSHSAYISPGDWTAYFNNSFGLGGPPSDTNAHAVKQWLDGTNANLTIDRAAFTAAYGIPLGVPVTSVALGAGSNSGSNSSAASIAFFLVCASKPTDAEVAALDAWAARYWGVPDRPPLPAAIHSWWSGSHGMTPPNAFDQQPTGITLPGASILAADLPIGGVDASAFNGQPVGQGNRNAYWQQASLVTTMLTNDRPWLYVVGRMTALAPGQQRVCGLGNNFIGLGE